MELAEEAAKKSVSGGSGGKGAARRPHRDADVDGDERAPFGAVSAAAQDREEMAPVVAGERNDERE